MRPLGWIGGLLIICGVIVAAMRGLPYTKSHSEVEVGPLKVTAKEQGIVPPYVGIIAIVVGGVLVAAGRKRSA